MIKPKSLEAMVVHDADVLDKMGMKGVVRHTWKIINLINPNMSTENILEALKQHLFWRKSLPYTNTAKSLSKKFDKELDDFFSNKPEARKIIKFITVQAKKGIISDEILRQIKQSSH